ncbi:helix-turn-helix transcriptional regulator [Neisseria sp. N95_16]|uniref:Helix-turn-helix domain-containing protein n=1 Tax=Neisseria brasiliensis TaxID=2666100 RepID=A0A7X2GXD4_9NEIS|nr:MULTISPECIES: S24 family peptidase [Neisseria]MRN37419.1 helix-turn-helix domain-containing protein [Neisseria brasiliensis]PJO09029.1 helix-turn-helix transcriptional regulator [Neisseria sp. N95_16]
MNTLADRIKQRLSDLDKTQADLAKYCKVKPPSVSKWLSGGTKTLQGQNLLRASEFLECDPDWLASGKGFWADTKNGNIKPHEAATSPYTVKMLGEDILAQYLINTSDIAANISYIEYTEDQYRRIFTAKNPSSIRLTNIKVDNMSGTLEPGDLVFVDISTNRYDGDGIYLFIVGNHLHLKRLQMAGSNLLVISDNRQYKSWEISPKDKSTMVVVGKVLLGQSQIFQRF